MASRQIVGYQNMPSEEKQPERNAGRKRVVVGSVGVFIGSLCCLPLLGAVLGTIGGLGLIIGLATYRVPLTLLGVGLFLLGVFQYHRAKKRQVCET